MNRKAQFLSVLNHEKPISYMGYAFNAFPEGFPVIWDPITMMDASGTGTYTDPWGALWRHNENDPGAVPLTNSENKVIKDIKRWRDYVTFPDVKNLDWSGAIAQIEAHNREEMLIMVPSFYGPFERLHSLMPFEDVLLALAMEPDTVSEILDALADWKIAAIGEVIDRLAPDIIHSHDDWGSRDRLLFSPRTFRGVLKPHYKKIYEYIHRRGVLVQHHADCYIMGLECDMVDIGVDMWQGAIPSNDINLVQKNTDGKLLVLGGIDQTLVDMEDVGEDVLRAEARRVIDEYAPGGAFLPCIPSVVSIYPQIMNPIIDELNSYGAKWLAAQRRRHS